MLGLQALLAATLAASPAVAGVNQAEPKKPDDLGKQLADMQKALEDSIKNLRTDLNVYDQTTRADLRELKDRVAQLEKQVKDMESRLNQMPSTRQAFSPPATGRIRLMNMYNVPATVRVNRIAYRLQPGEQRMLEGQPVGAFTYEVMVDPFGQVQPPTDRVLGANEVFTIYVYPR
jgi:hypothetical protein